MDSLGFILRMKINLVINYNIMKVTDKITITNEDNMLLMARYPDNYFDLAIVDPPYGLGDRLSNGGGKRKDDPSRLLYVDKKWDILPSSEYWKELFRVSKNQVVFGANYFLEYLPNTRGFVCWDKNQAMPTLSACELVWTSFDKPAKIMKKSSTDLERFHPTQKPIYVYQFMFEYCKTKQGDKIIDTHLGSGSIAIACHDYGFELTACELDKEYYDKAIQRIKSHTNQQKINFDI
jgi:site-specific DNA-methyltransferase (adenine-specific)